MENHQVPSWITAISAFCSLIFNYIKEVELSQLAAIVAIVAGIYAIRTSITTNKKNKLEIKKLEEDLNKKP